MEYNEDKIDESVLALLYLTLQEECRAWKGHDFDALHRLHEKGYRAPLKTPLIARRGN